MQFPDPPNVFSAADDEDAIILNAIEALRLAAEDGELGAPSSHAARRGKLRP